MIPNTVRPTSLTYPDGRVITLDYGTAGGINDAASRIQAVKDGALVLVQYAYLGQATFVEADDTEPDVKWTLVDLAGNNDPNTGDIYSGLDRFGRVKDNRWYDYGSSTDADRIEYGYDRVGNRLWRENVVATSLNKNFDELYTYDGLYRLIYMQRGRLNAQRNAITSLKLAQQWLLDATGNWDNFKQDDNGDGTWDLDQDRTANKVNEITGITETAGPAWATPAYSRAGNMTTVPQPADLTASYAAAFDAWNRMVKLTAGADTVQENEYDGLRRRTVRKDYMGGSLDETRHFYYSQTWQVLEERLDTSVDPNRQFVWGLRYIDDLICRDHDTTGDGTLDERLYALQDANWNVTAVTDTGGDVQERYAYQAYGQPLFLAPNYTTRTSSSFDWGTLFAGYRWDQTTGVYLDRHRPLHVHLGSWMQRDMLGYIDGMSLYGYVRSNPLRYTDPSGEVIPVIIVGASCLACFEAMRTFLTTAHNICEDSDSVAGYSACMIDKISEMESRLDWYRWTVINAACICCGGGIAGAAKKFIKKFAQKWVKKTIAKCQALHAAYKALNCKGCGGATTRAEVQKNIACLTAETAGRASYLKKKCDYVLPGSIGRGSKKAEKGHQTELANKTRVLAKCVAKLAAMP